MFEADSAPLTIGLAVSLLLLAPFAGCLQTVGEATQDAITDREPEESKQASDNEEAPQADTEAAEDRDAPALEEGDVADTYEAAFSSVEPGDDELRRVSLDVHADPADSEESFDLGVYWNAREKVTVMTFENGTPGGGDLLESDQFEGLLIGTVNKTTFFGTPTGLMTHYNESQTWDEDPFNVSDTGSSSMGSGSSDDSLDFSSMMEALDELPADADIAWNTITYQGQQVQEIEIQHENETQFVDMRAVVDMDEERPLLLEGTYENATTNRTYLEIAFAYGEDAQHDHADELVRLEAMAVERDGNRSLFGGSNETQTLTVLPSQNPGMIALEEVEVHLRSSQGDSSSGEPESKVVLPAEEGRVVTDDAELVYEDVDGDGAVSPGDEIRFTPLSDEAESWSPTLYDEQTQMHVTPGPGLWAGLAVLGLAALTLGRRRP